MKMKSSDYSDVLFYEQLPPLDVLLDIAKDCADQRKLVSAYDSLHYLPTMIQDQLINALYSLGVGLIRYGIYKEGIKCFEEALAQISNNPAQYLIDDKVIPLSLLDHDNLPSEFYSIVHTLTIFYRRTEQKKRFTDLIINNIFIKRGNDFKSWLSEWLRIERYRRKCLELQSKKSFKSLIGVSEKWYEILSRIQTIAKSNENVLITGPSGTGKGVVAKSIHDESGRSYFIRLNCASISDNLLASQLYGVEKGAFTDAIQTKGLCEAVGTGTLFLDEIGSTSLIFQAGLLRLLQEKEFMHVGGLEMLEFKGRVIAADNQDLKKLIREDKFRKDLYDRLDVHKIEIPPLSERPLDIEELILHFIRMYPGKRKRISIEAVNGNMRFL